MFTLPKDLRKIIQYGKLNCRTGIEEGVCYYREFIEE